MILSKISNRLLAIANLIKKDSIIADVCSDHALLGCYLLSNSFCKFVYNIDINNEPLQSGIKNLTKYGVIEKSCNILADGLNTNEIDKHIDTCVIAGIGSNAIINILNNKNKSILIDEYIFVPSEKQNNIFLLRQWIKENKYFINNEEIVIDSGKQYILIKIDKHQGKKVKNKTDIYIGPILKNNNDDSVINYFNSRYNYLQQIINITKNKNIIKEYKTLKKYNTNKSL